MLTGLLSALQGALSSFTKGFLVSALLPVTACVAITLLLLNAVGVHQASFASLTAAATDGVPMAFALLGILVAAFMLTSVQPWLHQLLEGGHLPVPVARALVRAQSDRLDRMRRHAEDAYAAMSGFDANRKEWDQVPGRLLHETRPASVATHEALQTLLRLRRNGEEIKPAAVRKLMAGLRVDMGHPGAPAASPMTLENIRLPLMRVIAYAHDRSRQRYLQTQTLLQFCFPGDVFDPDPSSDNVLAPTAFGNIGRTMRSYALRRYGIDLDIFWTRIQKVMADSQNSKMYDALQTQKTHVDLIVTLFWMTVLLGVVWIPWLAVEQGHPRVFRVVALAAPAAAGALYYAACRAYLLFADQVRAAIDYFRFDVLRGLHVAIPSGTAEEELIWRRLGERIGYGNADATFIYVHPQQ